MFPSLYLALCLLQVPGEPELQGTPAAETMHVKVDEAGLALDWADVEDRLQGTVQPNVPRFEYPLRQTRAASTALAGSGTDRKGFGPEKLMKLRI